MSIEALRGWKHDVLKSPSLVEAFANDVLQSMMQDTVERIARIYRAENYSPGQRVPILSETGRLYVILNDEIERRRKIERVTKALIDAGPRG